MSKPSPTCLLKPRRKIKFGDRTYEIEGFIDRGGSGEVYKARLGNRLLAVKVFFPFYQMHLFSASSSLLPRTVKESLTFQQKEYEFLSRLSHPNIVRVYDAGEVPLTKGEQAQVPIKDVTNLPALVMDFVDGRPLKEAIEEFSLSADQLAHVLLQVARALEYLHKERRYMHADIKSGNILVRRSDLEPVLIDFALCKNLNFAEVSKSDRTILLGDWDLFPKNLPTEHRLKLIKESGGLREELFELAFPYLDLFQVGKMLTALQPVYRKVFDDRESAYLEALASQLSDWTVVTKWNTGDLAPRISRLGPEHFAAFGIPELTPPTSAERIISIPPATAVPITSRIEEIIRARSFRRLMTINQLGLLGYVYPGADYKRWVHVLFAYDIARQFVTHLYGSPTFRVLFDKKSAQQLLVVTLLHDINHFPFLHIFQESGIPGLDRLQVVDLFCKGEATGERQAKKPSIYELLDDIGVDPDRFKRLVFLKHHEQLGPNLEVDQTISSLLNSGVDVDKLSYLVLDSHFTGVPYGGGIDLSCVVQTAILGRVGRDKAPHIAFTDRAIQALENVVMTRFWNFRSVYWHHTNRAIMAMILAVVRKLYAEQNRAVQDYLLQTMWLSDLEALRFLDKQFQTQFGQPSILSGMIEDRGRIYKRIYTVRAGVGDGSEDALYGEFRRLDYGAELTFRRHLASALGQYFSSGGSAVAISDDELLVDIPRREMDGGGAVYVSTSDGQLSPLANLSEPIRSISSNYELLAKRVRIFLSPRLAGMLHGSWRANDRVTLQGLIQTALNKSREKSQIQ